MTYPEENSSRFRRQRTDLAITLATQSRWEEASEANQEILRVFPNDVDALNRLGKASLELGRYAEARAAYGKAVTIEPSNTIARKNLSRLAAMKDLAAEPAGVGTRVDPSLFIEEAGKTAVVALQNLGTREALGKTTAGDMLEIRQEGSTTALHLPTGELVGYLDPKMSARMTRLLGAGNRYEAAVTSATDQQVRVILREVYQTPDMAGRPSFPVKADTSGFRPYIKDSVLQYGLDDDDDDDDENFREDDDDVTDWDDSADDASPAAATDDDSDDESEE